jgi:DNA-directed RNA polymerase subunit RPC12/RpoP
MPIRANVPPSPAVPILQEVLIMTVVYDTAEIFTCDDCGHHRIEEVLVEAVVTTEVVSVDKWGYMQYAEPDVGTGNVECYRCVYCGKTVDKDDLLERVGCTDSPRDSSFANPEG